MSHKKYRRYPQIAAAGKLVLPEDKPDIDFLLRATSTPAIEQCVVNTKQIQIRGYINLYIEYVTFVSDGTQPVAFTSFTLPFDKTFSYHRARTGMHVYLKCEINQQHLQLSKPREIETSVTIKISRAKLSRVYHPSAPHYCKPYLVDFFKSGIQPLIVPPKPEQYTDS